MPPQGNRVAKFHRYGGYIRVKFGLEDLLHVKNVTFCNPGGKYLNCYESLLHLEEASGTASHLQKRTPHTVKLYLKTKIYLNHVVRISKKNKNLHIPHYRSHLLAE